MTFHAVFNTFRVRICNCFENFLSLKSFIAALYMKRASTALKFAEQQTVTILEYDLKLFK
jgi:hypothetical protein